MRATAADRHAAELRDPAQVVAQWEEAGNVSPELLAYRASDAWWGLLARLGVTLFVTREYEHLVLAMNAIGGRPRISFLRLPHPSGLVVDRSRGGITHVACTRNPNQILTLLPGGRRRVTERRPRGPRRALLPVRALFYPGALYLHDLAVIGARLYGNAVGHNAVVELLPEGGYHWAWWPRCVERGGRPAWERNYLQLNSIAAGPDLDGSYFTASTDRPGRRWPGQVSFPVDGRGVVFSGRSRDVVARGLTRPHSARLKDRQIWVDNSGYGEVGMIRDGAFEAVARLPGWTRGLCFVKDVLFAGTSRIIARFRAYAPGVTAQSCGIHAVSRSTGRILASITWPAGNQVFAVDWCPTAMSGGLPFLPGRPSVRRANARELFYRFQPGGLR